jgi:putative FmdB family regulatory protein
VPTYQYACTACSEPLEVVQKFTDAALTECPACGGRLRKVFSAAAIVFRGSGFYRTDSRTNAAKTSSADSAKKDGAKTESAPSSSSDSSDSSGSSGSSGTKSAESSSTSSSAEKVA